MGRRHGRVPRASLCEPQRWVKKRRNPDEAAMFPGGVHAGITQSSSHRSAGCSRMRAPADSGGLMSEPVVRLPHLPRKVVDPSASTTSMKVKKAQIHQG